MNGLLQFIGNSVIALLLATLVSFWTLGLARGFSRDDILKFTNECLAPPQPSPCWWVPVVVLTAS
jgi:GntP family gluconate:H+ symporter